MIDHQIASEMPLSNYLLRSAAVHTWDLGQHIFRQILKGYEPQDMSEEQLAERRRLWKENPEEVRITATSGDATSPREISTKGLLQHFTHRSDGAEVVMYVDTKSPDNALRLALGTVFYDVRYEHPEVPGTKGPINAFAQRQIASPKVQPETVKSIVINGRFRSLDEVRGAQKVTD